MNKRPTKAKAKKQKTSEFQMEKCRGVNYAKDLSLSTDSFHTHTCTALSSTLGYLHSVRPGCSWTHTLHRQQLWESTHTYEIRVKEASLCLCFHFSKRIRINTYLHYKLHIWLLVALPSPSASDRQNWNTNIWKPNSEFYFRYQRVDIYMPYVANTLSKYF